MVIALGARAGATLTMHDDIFVQLVSGEIDAMMALLRGKVMLTGSKKQGEKCNARSNSCTAPVSIKRRGAPSTVCIYLSIYIIYIYILQYIYIYLFIYR